MRFNRKAGRAEFNNGFGYYGFGNVKRVFNRKPKPAFQEIRSFYEDQMVRHDEIIDHTSYGKLPKEEKVRLKEHVLEVIRKEKRRQFNYYLVYSILILTIGTFFISLMN